MSQIDSLLELLADGEWHPLSEIREKSRLASCKAQEIINFLSEYNLIELETELQEVRLTPKVLRFFRKIHAAETP